MALILGSVGVMLVGFLYMETHIGAQDKPLSTPEAGIGCGIAVGAVATALLTGVLFYLFTHLEFHA